MQQLTTEAASGFSLGEPDLFADKGETMRDVRTCEALHEARAAFQESLVAGSLNQSLHFVSQLRQESAYQMAEFLYLLRAFRIDSEDQIRRYADLHNRHLETLTKDRAKLRRLGLSPTRVLRGMFSPESIPKLVENYRSEAGAIDQSDLARLLIEVMSPETCRKTTMILTKAGYMERWRSPYQSVLVRSTGVLECLFARSLRHVRISMAAEGGTTGDDDQNENVAHGKMEGTSPSGVDAAPDDVKPVVGDSQ